MIRRLLALVGTLVVALVAVMLTPLPAGADPGDSATENTPAALAAALSAVAQNYYDSKIALDASQSRQADLQQQITTAQAGLDQLSGQVAQVAGARYKGSQLGILDGLLTGANDPTELLDAATIANYLAWRDDQQLHAYRQALDDATREKAELDAETTLQAKYVAALDQQKRDAEKALAAVGGLVTTGYSGSSFTVQPAPRNADGSWPTETCSVYEAATGHCITPRLYHAVTEAREAGFLLPEYCWRQEATGEHPLGRACDFTLKEGGFGDQAVTGDAYDYGERLAAFFVDNADALGVYYVIFYRQIWLPGIGWRSYSGCCDASSEHTNHVHLSII